MDKSWKSVRIIKIFTKKRKNAQKTLTKKFPCNTIESQKLDEKFVARVTSGVFIGAMSIGFAEINEKAKAKNEKADQ